MIIKTRIFDLANGNYSNLSDLAQAMGISVSQIYRVRTGKRQINQKFITGATSAFPEYRLDELFYLAHDLPPGNNAKTVSTTRHYHMVQQYTNSSQPTI